MSLSDSCSSNLNLDALSLPFNTTSLRCDPVWSAHDYILRRMGTGGVPKVRWYEERGAGVWSFVLSAPNPNSYVGIGFSSNGNMVGSSAVVGWISRNGSGVAKHYYLSGQTEGQVLPDQGNLPTVDGSMGIVSLSSRLFLFFQLNTPQPQSKIIYSLGPTNVVPLDNGILSKHQDKVSTHLDYNTGTSSTESPYTTLRRSHGILNMVGWGILLPLGAIIARYLKDWDPTWFYAHVSIQCIAFAGGLAGVILGLTLEDKISADVTTHKALGILILVLGSLQVMALLVRPDKASKVRKYWTWYHSGVGKVLIGFAVGNIFYGISLGGEGRSWNIGYGVVVGCLVLLSLVLEARPLIACQARTTHDTSPLNLMSKRKKIKKKPKSIRHSSPSRATVPPSVSFLARPPAATVSRLPTAAHLRRCRCPCSCPCDRRLLCCRLTDRDRVSVSSPVSSPLVSDHPVELETPTSRLIARLRLSSLLLLRSLTDGRKKKHKISSLFADVDISKILPLMRNLRAYVNALCFDGWEMRWLNGSITAGMVV
ncbi:hypothetical protein ACLOJK_008947 [Asimina triloba]